MSQPNYPPPYGPPPGPQRHTQVTKRGANHGLHVFLSIITCGLWAITGWPIAAAMGRKTKTTVMVTPPQGPYASAHGHPGPPVQPGPYGPPQHDPYGATGQFPTQGQQPPQPPTTTSWGRPPQQ